MKCGSKRPDNGGCYCNRELDHLGNCRCSCGTTWAKPASRNEIADEDLPVEESDLDDF